MAYTITNNSRSPRGVYSASGRLVFIQPGESRTMDVANIEGERHQPDLHIVVADPLPEPPADLVAAVAGNSAPSDDMKALRAAYAKKLGKRPFPAWGAADLKRRMGDA